MCMSLFDWIFGVGRLMYRAMVAEMDEEKDSTINYTEIKAEPLGEIKF